MLESTSTKALKNFHPLIQRWFSQSLGSPTPIQELSWKAIAEKEHVLLTAPTGSGKTLASFLWSINQLITQKDADEGISILYISPLKALNNDIYKNLTRPLEQLRQLFESEGESFPSIGVAIRSGDTPQSERQRIYKKPPRIFITTPESLHILLTSPRGRTLFRNLKAVILDEIHAVLESRRGILLTTGMERLVQLNGEFQRIGLSATVEPLERAARFLGGFRQEGEGLIPRRVVPLRDPTEKKYTIEVIHPPDKEDEERWASIARLCLEIIEQNRSVLFFTDGRRITEKAARLINDLAGETIVWAHHGSLARELRHQVEQRMKEGELRAIVATSSLELGIDIGSLDRVVLLQCPSNISSAVQRMGRAGHQVGEVSHSTLIPMHPGELLPSAALIRAMAEKEQEQIHPLRNALDVLAQLILSITHEATWREDDLFRLLMSTWTYHELPRKHFDLTLEMLSGRYSGTTIKELQPRIIRDTLEGTVRAREKGSWLIYTSGGVIPDRGYYDLRLAESKTKIGELDEEFVWERQLGESFTLGNQVWKILKITDSHVEVIPATGIINIVPFWKAEDMNRSPRISTWMGRILDQAEEARFDKSLIGRWQKDFHFDKESAQELLDYLKSQSEASKSPLPGEKHILMEHCRDNAGGEVTEQLIIHTLKGGAINQPLAIALVQAWQDKTGIDLPYFVNNDGITLLTAGPLDPAELLEELRSDNLVQQLRKRLSGTAFFGSRFRECAGRALLLPRRQPKGRVPLWLTRLRARKLLGALEQYEDFPITLEAWRTSLEDHFDLENTVDLIEQLRSGEVTWTACHTDHPTPFADSLVWRQVNLHMYDDDTPAPKGETKLSENLLKELLQSSQLKPQIPVVLVKQLEDRLQRLRMGYGAENGEELRLWLDQRRIIPFEEWQCFLERSEEDSSLPKEELLQGWEQEIQREGNLLFLQQNRKDWERLHGEEAEEMLWNLMLYTGPRPIEWWEQLLERPVRPLAEALIESGKILYDQMLEGSEEKQLCTMENLEYLLRMAKNARRPQLDPRPLEDLPLYTALRQGLVHRSEGIEGVQAQLDRLVGLPLPLDLWERGFFPCRMDFYQPRWLDEILQQSGIEWRGDKGKAVSFLFPEEQNLWMENQENPSEDNSSRPEGLFDFFHLKKLWNRNSRSTAERIWEMVWRGQCSNDGFQVLRKGLQSKFRLPDELVVPDAAPARPRSGRRGHYNRWASQRPMEGHWFFPEDPEASEDELEEMERKKERVRQLLSRYGILSRPLLQKEKSLLGWRALFPALRLMELSGELISGIFFSDLPSLQFTTGEYLREWKDLNLWQENIWFLNARDPASLAGCGIPGLQETLPRRIAGNWMIYQGNRLMVTLEKKGTRMTIHHPPEQDFNPRAFWEMLLTRETDPLQKIEVLEINGEPAPQSPWKGNLKSQGFQDGGDRMILRRKY